MEAKPKKLIACGVEPVDELLGGLEKDGLYIVHGDAAGKSLFGIKFLIEGLKRGESGALVIRYSPEDAVRRFARLGYDCLEDIYSGRLVILEYTNDIVQQIARLREITPVLRELEWLLGETRPHRVIFDPVAHLVLGEKGNLIERVRAFADWARSFGATTVLVANGEEQEVVKYFKPLVKESFRFEVKEKSERATRFFVFEKSPSIPDQAIEVDPSRGVFLLARAQEHFATRFKVPSPPLQGDSLKSQEKESPPRASEQTIEANAIVEPTAESSQSSGSEKDASDIQTAGQARQESVDDRPAVSAFESSQELSDAQSDSSASAHPSIKVGTVQSDETRPSTDAGADEAKSVENKISQPGRSVEGQSDILSDLLDDLAGVASPIDLDALESEPVIYEEPNNPPAPDASIREERFPAHSEPQARASENLALSEEDRGFPDTKEYVRPRSSPPEMTPESNLPERDRPSSIGLSITKRAVEILLRPPGTDHETSSTPSPALPPPRLQEEPQSQESVNAKDFNVLVIDDNLMSSEVTAQELSDYTVEVVHDGVSGLAKLISFKPDLVILNVDLPIVDGFKILAHIRSSLNMPIIIISGSHMRASDRVLATELGADHYMTKPFSVKELRQKVRQLIARYRGISSWIITTPAGAEPRAARASRKTDRVAVPVMAFAGADNDRFTPYQNFVASVEKSVKSAIDSGSSFSIVGCRLSQMTSNGGQWALRLFELVRSLVRDTDLISTNSRNDLVVFLADADGEGAQAFTGRLRERVKEEMNEEPSMWLRSFPDIEEAVEPATPDFIETNGKLNRRASDADEGPKADSRVGEENS